MGLRENAPENKANKPALMGRKNSSIPLVTKKKQKHHKNYKQILILSLDAIRERKLRSTLTILMVVAGGALMVALNGMSAGNMAFVVKQFNSLAPNVMFVTSGQHGFHKQSKVTGINAKDVLLSNEYAHENVFYVHENQSPS